jgi:hypothetical protein
VAIQFCRVIAWSSKKQGMTAKSRMEAECQAFDALEQCQQGVGDWLLQQGWLFQGIANSMLSQSLVPCV